MTWKQTAVKLVGTVIVMATFVFSLSLVTNVKVSNAEEGGFLLAMVFVIQLAGGTLGALVASTYVGE